MPTVNGAPGVSVFLCLLALRPLGCPASAERRAHAQGAETDQNHPDHHLEDLADLGGQTGPTEGEERGGPEQRRRVAEAPGGPEPRGAPASARAGHEGGDRRHVIGLEGMADAEQGAEEPQTDRRHRAFTTAAARIDPLASTVKVRGAGRPWFASRWRPR